MNLFGAPLAGAALALLAALPAAAQMTLAPYGETRGWTVRSASHLGSFMSCRAAPSATGQGISVNYSQEGWVLAVHGTISGDSRPGTIDIDRASFRGTFYRGDDALLWFLSDAELAALRDGSRLVATPSGMAAQTTGLGGSAAALLKIEECFANGGVAPQSAPVLAADTTPGKAVPAGVRIWPKDAAKQPVESDAAHFGKGCPAWGQYVSGPSQVATKARFMNKADRAVTVYWIDFKGLPVEYAGLMPGEEFRVDTFEGHVWIAKDFAGECLGGGALFPRQGKKNKFELK